MQLAFGLEGLPKCPAQPKFLIELEIADRN